jgi:hypothetical protein
MATFLQLQTEFYARGFDYLNDGGVGVTRAKAWLNQSYLELCEEELWPFLLTSATGAAPLIVTDLRTTYTVVETVTSRELQPSDEDELVNNFTLLTTTGTPIFYYVDDVTIKTYPVGGTLRVRYWNVPVQMVATTDVAIVPDRFTNLIVDGAVRRAANDNDDDGAAKRAEDERQRGLDLMRRSLMFRDGMRQFQRVTYTSGDW